MHTQAPLFISKAILEKSHEVSSGNKPFFIKITPATHATPMNCFVDVKAQIHQHGGKSVYGWSIYEWPRVLCEFEFHCLWESPTQELFDISPRHDKEQYCLFLRDETRGYTGKRIQNVRFSLSGDPTVKKYIDLANRRDEMLFNANPHEHGGVVVGKMLLEVDTEAGHLHEILVNAWSPQNNDPCPCGSRIKFKKCHGQT